MKKKSYFEVVLEYLDDGWNMTDFDVIDHYPEDYSEAEKVAKEFNIDGYSEHVNVAVWEMKDADLQECWVIKTNYPLKV